MEETKEVVTETPVKKQRKPRTPKAKPAKKERIGLGPIRLCLLNEQADGAISVLELLDIQPPPEVSNDTQKVVQWAAEQQGLAGLGPIIMVRSYNAKLIVEVTQRVKARTTLEVPQKQENV